MPQTIPTLDEQHERLLDDYKARLPTHDASRYSDNWKRLRILALATWGLHHSVQVVEDDLFPDTAAGAALDRLMAIWGLTRKPATASSKPAALRITGTLAASITTGMQLVHSSGLVYQVNETTSIPAALYIDVDVLSISTGSATKLNAGEILTFSPSQTGLTDEAELRLDIDVNGADLESDASARTRLLNRISQPGAGGNANDYVQWAVAIDDIVTAYTYPLRRGRGSVDLAVLQTGSGSARLPDATKRTEVYDAIEEVRPVTVKAFRVLEVTAQSQNIDIVITPQPGSEYRADWSDPPTPLEVSSWTAGTRTLQFTTDRPSDMAKGGRLVIKTAAGDGDGVVHEIEALGSGSDDVVLREAPTTAPVATDTVYAGGNLTKAVRDVLTAFVDAFGPAIGLYGTGEWVADMVPARLLAVALAVTGMHNASVVTPSADVVPADTVYPNDTTIPVLTWGEVVVRYS